MSILRSSILLAASAASLAHAFTQPTNATWGALLTPDLSHPVTQGEPYLVTWNPDSHPTDGVTVSLVLCSGPSSNCVTAPTAIVEGVPAAAKSYSWTVPCSLPAGQAATETGHGMLIIVDGTSEFQYSTQFSVLSSDKCSSSESTGETSSNSTSTDVSESLVTSSSASSTPTPSTESSSSAGWSTFISSGGQVGASIETSTAAAASSSASSCSYSTLASVSASATTTGPSIIPLSTGTGTGSTQGSSNSNSTWASASSSAAAAKTSIAVATGAAVSVPAVNAATGMLTGLLLAGAAAIFAI